jgi:hypothetical protein
MPEKIDDENKGKKTAKGKAQKKPTRTARAPLKALNKDLAPIREGVFVLYIGHRGFLT